MNILVLSWRDPKHPLAGGAEQVMHEHMKGWIDDGHVVTLFTSHFKGGKRNDVIDEVSIVRYGVQLLGVHIAAFFWYFFGKHSSFDLIIDQFHGIPFFTPLYTRVPKLAVIQEVAGKVWFKNDLPKPLDWIIGWIGYITEPIILKLLYRNTQFMTGSVSAQNELIRVGIRKEKITIVSHGVLVILPSQKIKKEKKRTVVFLGALAKDKGIEDAIEVFSILKSKGDYQFWIVGKGGHPYIDHLQDLVSARQLKTDVTFFGFVDQKKKFELLAKASVLINPSVLEGWGLVNIEANAVGTPVVAYSSLGLVDSVKHDVSGLLCTSNSPQELAKQVENLLSDKKNYDKMQKSAIKWSQKFSWQESKKQSLSLINKIING